MTLIEIVREFSRRTGLIPPSAVATSGDDQVLQIMGLANEVLDNLEERKTFTGLQTETTFVSVATEFQGYLSTIAPGFSSLIDSLMFNRTEREVIFGPLRPSDWQAKSAGIMTISSTQYRIKGNQLLLNPAPAVGSTIAFEYKSSYPLIDGNTGLAKQYFSADTDTFFYPDKLLILGLRWKWKREKGLRYAEDFRDYEVAVANFCGSDGGNAVINLAGGHTFSPGIHIPDQGWNVP